MRGATVLHRLAAKAVLLFGVVGCQTHDCRCYLLERWGNVKVQHTLIDRQTPCADLGWDFPHPTDSSFRFCTDWEAPEMDTMDVVRMFWGKYMYSKENMYSNENMNYPLLYGQTDGNYL